MQFNMPKRTEKTLLEELCEKYGATLNVVEWTIMAHMSDTDIETVLLYELKKAVTVAQCKIRRIEQRLHRLDERYRSDECDGNGELCMRLLAESEHLELERKRTVALCDYLRTLGK